MACYHLHKYLIYYNEHGDVDFENSPIGTIKEGSWR